jgi:hypothetical protein
MEDHIPDSTDPQKGLRHPYGLREHYLRSHEEEGEGVYADWGAVRKAVQALDAEIQEQERLVRSPLAWRIFLLSFQWFLRIFTFILCSLYVTPQAILAGDALNNSLPGGLVGYINWLGLRSTTAGVLFNLGLTCFFWNFITAFFEKVMAKHLRMIAADFKEIGFGWEWKRYVKALFNQHILMWFSLLIGVLAIPPFMYIFQVGSRAIDAADDLEGPAQWMCALLKWLKPTHFLIVYYNAFLVASTCQSLFERLVNYGRAKMEGDPAANLKQMILKWLESFKEVTQKETIQMPLHKMGMKDATPIYYASVYYASQVFVEEKKMPQQHPFEPLWA